MKEKIIYFLLGILTMFVINKLIAPPSIQSPPQTTTNKTNTSSPALADNQVSKQPKELPNKPTDTATKQTELAAEQIAEQAAEAHRPKMDRTIQRALIRNLKLQKLKPKIAAITQQDIAKAEQLELLLATKMEKDDALSQLVTMGFDEAMAQTEEGLMTKPENELTAEQLARKRAKNEQQQAHREAIENNRREFEDSLNNLLSDTELEAFRQDENAQINQNYQKHLGAMSEHAKATIPDLNEFQQTQLQDLLADYSAQQITDVPIGSSISTSPLANAPETNKLLNEYRERLRTVLTDAQYETFNSKPVMLMF